MLKRTSRAVALGAIVAVLGAGMAYATEDGATGGDGGIDIGAEQGGDNSSGTGNDTGDDKPAGNNNGGSTTIDEECTASALECATLDPITQPQDPGDPPANVPDAVVLAQTAKGRIDFKAPQIGLSPVPPNPALVNLQTWLWLEDGFWAPLEGSVTAGDTTVTATARPVSVRWNMWEGSKVCQGPGTPWRKGLGQKATTSCGFTYRHTSVGQPGGAFRISATVMYDSSWTCKGECTEDGGDLGLLPSPVASTSLRVTERQTVVE